MNYTFEQFEKILLTKEYNQLNELEKKIVEAFCDSPNEFALMKRMTTPNEIPLTPTPAIYQSLLKKMDSQYPSTSPFAKALKFKIPIWLFLVSLIGASLLTYFLIPSKLETNTIIKEIPKEFIKEVPKKIIKEIPIEILKTDTIIQYAYVHDTIYIKKAIKLGEAPKALVYNKLNPQKPIKGRSIKENRGLKEFITEIR